MVCIYGKRLLSSFFIFGIARDELEDNYFTSISPVIVVGRCMIQYAVPEEPTTLLNYYGVAY